MNIRRIALLVGSFVFLAAMPSCTPPSKPISATLPASQPATKPVAERAPIFDIPQINLPSIDADHGFVVPVLQAARRLPTNQFDAQLRLAWNEQGLLLRADVTEADLHESEDDLQLELGSSIGMTQTNFRGNETWQISISPGVDPRHPIPRTSFYDERSKTLRHVNPSVQTAVEKTMQGYILQAMVPWDILNIAPKNGSQFSLVVRVNHPDARQFSQLTWSPAQALPAAKGKQLIRLAQSPTTQTTVAADGTYERMHRVRLTVAATADQAGKIVQFKIKDGVVGQEKLQIDAKTPGRLASAEIHLPMPPMGKTVGNVTVLIDDKPSATIALPSVDATRKAALAELRVIASSPVFVQSTFPVIDFASSTAAEDLIGNYTIHATYYDADFHVVTSANRPGRYGAVAEITPEVGKSFKRSVTLFHAPAGFNYRPLPIRASVQLPVKFGVDASIDDQVGNGEFVAGQIINSVLRDDSLAVYLAGLSELPPGSGDQPERLGPTGRNLSWWYGLKKQTGSLVHYNYLVHLPDLKKPGAPAKFPLIIFLHGIGERGTNLDDLTRHGPPKLLKTEPNWAFKDQFIVVSPQCFPGETWNPLLLRDLLDEVSAKYPVDVDRVYLTGLSMGGFGTWLFAEWFPERFAAVVPISAGGDPADVSGLKEVPTWVFQGQRDATVKIESAELMVAAMRKIHARIRYTVYPDQGHNAWLPAYDDPELYQWLLKQKRGQPEQAPAREPG